MQECKSGVWFSAAASAGFLLQQASGDPQGEVLWNQALDLMGGDYAALSKAWKGGRDDSIMDLVNRDEPSAEDQP